MGTSFIINEAPAHFILRLKSLEKAVPTYAHAGASDNSVHQSTEKVNSNSKNNSADAKNSTALNNHNARYSINPKYDEQLKKWYVAEKRIQEWLNANRLQLPLHSFTLNPINSINNNPEKVNINTKNNSENEKNITDINKRHALPDVAIALESKKRDDGISARGRQNGVARQYRPSSDISIADFFAKINPSDESFYRYIPKCFCKSLSPQKPRL